MDEDILLYHIAYHSGNETKLFAPLTVEALEEALRGRIRKLSFAGVNLTPIYEDHARLHLQLLLEALEE